MTGEAQASDEVDHDSAVRHRKTLLGAVDFADWADRIGRFMAATLGVEGAVAIDDLSLPSAGGSSGTILFRATYDAPGGDRVSRRAVLRHATEGGLFHSYDVPGQYAIMTALRGSGVEVPGMIGVDRDGAVLGVPGYVMDWIDGEAPPPSYHHQGVLKDATPDRRRAMVRDALRNQAALHAQDAGHPGFAFLRTRGEGATAAERDINWWWASLTWGCPDKMAEVAPARQWLLDHQPPEGRLSVCHGDAMLPNYMYRDGKVVAMIDWELAFLGNPAHDIAYQYLAHRLLGLGSAPLEGLPDEAGWKADYEAISGTPLRHFDYCAAQTAYRMHIALLLVYRETAPGQEASRDAVLAHTGRTLEERLAAARRAAA